jgi:predicted DNA-binding transcriptional regulator YafY
MAMYILKILEQETDARHHLNQQEIINLLRDKYGMVAERKAVSRNIDALRSCGYEVVWDNGYYLASREFEDSELRLLIDSVIFSRHIKKSQRKELAEKLSSLSSKHFKSRINHISSMPQGSVDNAQLFYTVDVLDEAISSHRKVSFSYKEYRADKRLYNKREDPYVVSPYQIVAANSNYYLIANTDGHDNISHYRLDRIFDIVVLEEKARSKNEIEDLKNGFSLPKHMAEHIYMYSGSSIEAKFLADRRIVDQLFDWFGKSIKIKAVDRDFVEVTVKVNENAMYYWLLQYGEYVTLLEPDSLRQRIADTATDLSKRYSSTAL